MRETVRVDSAANRTTSVPGPSHLTGMTIGMLGLDRLHDPVLTAAFGEIDGILRPIRESHPFQKCEDWEPKIKRIATEGNTSDFKISATDH